ncbi:hypothetical protein DSO57_1024811 [Entomophthora muscae]|uniref:Uncharacterized protein n=1 Tax=Entomophthora muscae TaxID=34485 RepID=A0ACC2SRG3_9FUNG|nr:hypothetical protein DSO57_1024811 [Entomophthora muscae]
MKVGELEAIQGSDNWIDGHQPPEDFGVYVVSPEAPRKLEDFQFILPFGTPSYVVAALPSFHVANLRSILDSVSPSSPGSSCRCLQLLLFSWLFLLCLSFYN